jgi:hypothetical protein
MSATKPPNDIILYTYAFSPFGKRVSAYLALRGVEYGLCVGLAVYCSCDVSQADEVGM